MPEVPSVAYAGRMATNDGWTAELVRAIPDDGKRYELLDGELAVTPAPTLVHQRMIRLLVRLLEDYVEANGLGEVFASPADIEFSPQRLVQPDVLVIPLQGDGTRVGAWRDAQTLRLAVEVLSPATARRDRLTKRRIYMEEGVPEYWIVDLEARCVERWRRDDARPEVIDETLVWLPNGMGEALRLDLRALFARVVGEGDGP